MEDQRRGQIGGAHLTAQQHKHEQAFKEEQPDPERGRHQRGCHHEGPKRAGTQSREYRLDVLIRQQIGDHIGRGEPVPAHVFCKHGAEEKQDQYEQHAAHRQRETPRVIGGTRRRPSSAPRQQGIQRPRSAPLGTQHEQR